MYLYGRGVYLWKGCVPMEGVCTYGSVPMEGMCAYGRGVKVYQWN